MRFFGQKMGLKPAQEPPVKSFQHKKKSLFASFYLIFGMKSRLSTLGEDLVQISEKHTLFRDALQNGMGYTMTTTTEYCFAGGSNIGQIANTF